jgi:hypothetical protein
MTHDYLKQCLQSSNSIFRDNSNSNEGKGGKKFSVNFPVKMVGPMLKAMSKIHESMHGNEVYEQPRAAPAEYRAKA